jgi:NAD-dependent dihydropyrimidine dehydrogenase PreA subunit
MAIQKIDERLCVGCEICVGTCPMDVIRFDGEKEKAYVAYAADCMSCFLCEEDCPRDAIHVTTKRARAIPMPW